MLKYGLHFSVHAYLVFKGGTMKNSTDLHLTTAIIHHLLLCSHFRLGMHGRGVKLDLLHLGYSIEFIDRNMKADVNQLLLK